MMNGNGGTHYQLSTFRQSILLECFPHLGRQFIIKKYEKCFSGNGGTCQNYNHQIC